MVIASPEELAERTWSHVAERARRELPESSYAMWFNGVRATGLRDGVLEVVTPSEYVRDRLVKHYLDLIQTAAIESAGGPVRIHFGEPSPLEGVTPQRDTADAPAPPSIANVTPIGARTTMGAPGLPFPNYTFDAFVPGPSNRFAHAAAMAVAEAPPSKAYNPLFIYGGVGLGKTHLLVAIGRDGGSSPHFSIAHTIDAELGPTDSATFAIEVAGPEGYWAELDETLGRETLGEPWRQALELASEASERFAQVARPGTPIADAFGSVVEIVGAEGLRLGHSLGHGIGRDLVEEPRLGNSGASVFQDGMTFALHPHLVGRRGEAAYVADTFVVQPDRAVSLAQSVTKEPSWATR